MPDPFIVFSLPRSRSAWLSVLLGENGAPVGHDIAADCTAPSEFVWRLRNDLRGTCETGAAFAWPLICQVLPDARIAVVIRRPEEVDASLSQFGLNGYGPEMQERHRQLRAISALPNVFTCTFDDLRHWQCCAALYRHCLGSELTQARWRQLDRLNIQVDMARQVRKLAEGHGRIEALKAMAVEQMARA